MNATFYPPSPKVKKNSLTSLTSSYKMRAILAIVGIILFFVLYITLVIGAAYLFYYALMYDMGSINKLTILLKVGAIAGGAMLFFFTLKFIFKLKNHTPENRIQLKKEEHPDLWSFVDTICQETGAPQPKNIYVDPDVNAYVRYTNVWLSLFLPVKKELTIGLGLVDCLNLSEFKAVTAHEFGHFAQKSMKIGSYINSANTIIHGMIFERDRWDNTLEQWRGADIRLSAAAWIITPIIWIIRQLLTLFYQFLNIMYSSLSREMEFNADKVAVSTTGSDAIVSALWKLDDGSAIWSDTVNNAYLAAQKKMYVGNLYEHSGEALKEKIPEFKKDFEALPENPLGGKQFFSKSENAVVGMYASHPPNDLREKNAKSPYIKCLEDDRSPWILFGTSEKLQQEITALVYDKYLRITESSNTDFEAFQEFIKAETSGKDLLEEYQNTFLNRYLNVPELTNIQKIKDLGVNDPKHFEILKEELKGLMQPVNDLEALMTEVQAIAQGTSKRKELDYLGIKYPKKRMEDVYIKIYEDREKLFTDSFKEWDEKFCYSHLNIALKMDSYDQLEKHYKQHKVLSDVYKVFVERKNQIIAEVNKLQEKSEVTEGEVTRLSSTVKDMASKIEKELAAFDKVDFIALPNIDTPEELKNAILTPGALDTTSGNAFENGHFDTIIHTIDSAISHLHRVDQKSIASLLQKQKTIEEIWKNTLI